MDVRQATRQMDQDGNMGEDSCTPTLPLCKYTQGICFKPDWVGCNHCPSYINWRQAHGPR